MDKRITVYGTGNIGVTVNGIKILLSVNSAEQASVAAALAEAIAALGPEGIKPVEPRIVPAREDAPIKPRKRFDVGQSVWCTVSAIRGWKTVTEVNPKDGRIKIDGGRSWCPLHNFEIAQPEWQRAS